MKILLIGLFTLTSFSGFSKCQQSKNEYITYVCGDRDGSTIRNITMEKYYVKAKKKFADTACIAFNFGKARSFTTTKVDSSSHRIGTYLTEEQGLITMFGCASPFGDFLGLCQTKVLDSVECEPYKYP